MSGMFGTALNPATLIRKQWIAKEYLESDLFFIGRRDADFEHGYKPHVMQMKALVEIIKDGLEFSITDLTDVQGPLGTAGQILQVDPTGEFMEFVDPIDEFLDLLDTPVDYTGFAGYQVVVNQTEDGLEFIAPPPVREVRYESRVNFNDISAPTIAQNLIDDLGVTVTISRTALGTYRATFSASVDSSKLIAWLGQTAEGVFTPTAYTNTYIEFIHTAFVGGLVDAYQPNVSFEIKLYP